MEEGLEADYRQGKRARVETPVFHVGDEVFETRDALFARVKQLQEACSGQRCPNLFENYLGRRLTPGLL